MKSFVYSQTNQSEAQSPATRWMQSSNMMTFENWLINIGKSVSTAQKYSMAIQGSISAWAKNSGLVYDKIDTTISLKEFETLRNQISQLDIFCARNNSGKGMYGAALKHFGYFIEDLNGEGIKADIEEIVFNNEMETTEKFSLINARLGQGIFRQKLIGYWKGCAITGYKNTRMLIASHIKPWKYSNNQERLDVYNGILLVPNVDKAFDLGYVSFDEKGKILISKEMDNAESLGIDKSLRISLGDEHMVFMEFHREKIFDNHY